MRNTPMPCPRCGELAASIEIKLNCLEDEDAFHCEDCDQSFGVELLRSIVHKWAPVLHWLGQIPDVNPEVK
jgi:transposase-like protein